MMQDHDPQLVSQPISVGRDLLLSNRIVMLGMTRTRAELDGTPNDLMAQHYSQRAGAGLIITESTAVSASGRSFLNGPGIYTTEHAIGWRKVVDAVHASGGKIILQINHVGRLNNLQYLARAIPPVAPSAIAVSPGARQITINIPRVTPYAKPRALETDEIGLIVDEFARATRLAVFAGFDGVEIHADSGYLIHQFLSTNVNKRVDQYGGSSESRARLALEIVDAVCAVRGPEYVAIKLTPGFTVGEIEEDDLDESYCYLVDELSRRGDLLFLHLYFSDLKTSQTYRMLRDRFRGQVLAEGSLPVADYSAMITAGEADLIGFGRAFIANPDLPRRISKGIAWAEVDYDKLYTQGPEGYTDYPEAGAPEDATPNQPASMEA